MPDYCVDSNDAELAAIYAGLYRALRIWPNTEVFVVRSDSQVALRWAHKGYDGHRQTTRRLRSRIDHLHQTHEFRIVPKWVKGHRYGTKTDVYLNNRVDEMARAEMVKMREALRP